MAWAGELIATMDLADTVLPDVWESPVTVTA